MNILLTGAGSGLGASLRQMLLDQDHKVFGIGLKGPDMTMDFNSFSACSMLGNIAEIFNRAEDALGGRVSALVNNAGRTFISPIDQHQDAEMFFRVMNVNLMMPYALSREMVLRHAGSPHLPFKIVNTCSMASKISMRHSAGYCASKAALEALTRQMAKELADNYNATVIGISPGAIEDTAMGSYAVRRLVEVRGMSSSEAMQYFHSASPLKRSMKHAEACAVFDFAINHAPQYMSGAIIPIPGACGI